MADSASNGSFPLGRIASLLVLIAGGLYFTGWTYRWTYFSFFQLDVATLPLPVESFYMAAFHALLGGPWAILRTAGALVAVVIAAGGSLWLFERQLLGRFQKKARQYQSIARMGMLVRKYDPNFQSEHSDKNSSQSGRWRRFWHRADLLIANQLWALQDYGSFKFLRSLIDEVIIAICLLTALFWLARWQAAADAWLDAVNTTSTLPSVTIVVSDNTIPFGFNPNDLNNPNDIRIIGNINAYNSLLSAPINDSSNDGRAIVWKLLFDAHGTYYIFPAVPENSSRNTRPTLLVVPQNDNDDRLILLQPAPIYYRTQPTP